MTHKNVYIYSCDLRQSHVDENELIAVLNPKDRKRYSELKSNRSRLQFALARWTLKQALHELIKLPASHQYEIREFSDWQAQEYSDDIRISISHSGDLVVVAIAFTNCLLGVDVERHKKRNFDALVDGFCTENEQKALANSPNKLSTFYRLWTAKEAFLKASKMSMVEVCRQDLAVCLTSDSLQYGNYQYRYSSIFDNAYSLSLFSSCALQVKYKTVANSAGTRLGLAEFQVK